MSDFGRLTHRVDLVPAKERVIDHFPELAEYKEFSDPENDTLLRIAILATDEKSPFVQSERDDYEKKIRKIFEYLKITDEVLFGDIVNGIDRVYEQMVNRIFINSDNLAYVMWSDKFRNFHFIGLALREHPDMNKLSQEMDKRAKLGQQQQEIYKDLIELEAQIFPDKFTRKIIRTQVAKLLQPAEKYAVDKQVV